MKRVLFLAILTLPGMAVTQTKIATCPPVCATRDGNSLYSILGSYPKIRFFQLIGSLDHGLKGGEQIVKVSVRVDCTTAATYSKRVATWEVFMSNSDRGGMNATAALMQNHGTAPPRFNYMAKRSITFPLTPTPTTGPAPWGPSFPLDKPFLVLPAKASICVEFVTDGTLPYSQWCVDREWPSTAVNGSSPAIGTSCAAGGTLEADVGTLVPGGGAWFRVGGTSANYNNMPAFAVLGLSDKAWGPIALPFDLTPLGAPACNLYVGPWLFIVPGKITVPAISPMNNIDIFFSLPPEKLLLGATFYAQVVMLAPKANALGAAFTNGEKCILSTTLPTINMSYAYSYTPSAVNGLAYLNRGVVIGLHYF